MLFTSIAVLLPFMTIAVGSPLEARDTCNHDNVLRCLIGAPAVATPYCSSYLSKGVVTSYTATTTPTATAATTVTIRVTSPAAAAAAKLGAFTAVTTIYAGSTVTIAGPDSTSVFLNRRVVEARTTSASAPTCLAQYSAPASRLTSACNCLSITSSTLSTISTAPTATRISTVTATSTVAPTPTCANCNLCSSNADCKPGNECDAYIGFSFGDVNLCTVENIESSGDICGSICT